MKQRLLVAAVGVPLLIIILFFCPPIVLAVALSALSAIGAAELSKVIGSNTYPRMTVYSAVMAALIPLWSYFGCNSFLLAAASALFALLLFVEVLIGFPESKFSYVTGSLFGGVLIPLCLSSVLRIMMGDFGRALVVVPIMIPFISDSGGYFGGYFFGKHKLAPVLSPKKTREGAVGSLVTTALSMVIFGLIMEFGLKLQYNYVWGVIYGLLGSLISIVGDLSFSMIKREVGVKDYGKLFFAHGGVLDRFDSVVFAAPMVEILLYLIPIVS